MFRIIPPTVPTDITAQKLIQDKEQQNKDNEILESLSDGNLDSAIEKYGFEEPDVTLLRLAPERKLQEIIVEQARNYSDINKLPKSSLFDPFEKPITQEGIDSIKNLYDPEALRKDIGKSPEQLVLEYDYGVKALEEAKRRYPNDSRLKIPGVTIDVKTGQLVLPSYSESDIFAIAEAQDYFNQPDILRIKENDKTRYRNLVLEKYGELLAPKYTPGPEFRKSFASFFENANVVGFSLGTFDLLIKGLDNVAYLLKGKPERYRFVGSGEHDDKNIYSKINPFKQALIVPGIYNRQIQKQAAIEENLKRQTDPAYNARAEWIESTPFWSNFYKLGSGVLRRGVGDIAPSLLTSFGTASTVFKGSKALGFADDAAAKYARRATYTTTSLLEGGGYTSAALSELMTDKAVSNQVYLSNVNKYMDELLDEFVVVNALSEGKSLAYKDKQNEVDLANKKMISKKEYEEKVLNYAKENFYIRNNVRYEKGMSAEDALDAVMMGAVAYSQIAAVIENAATFKIGALFDNKWGKAAIQNSFFRNTVNNVKRQFSRIPKGNTPKVLKMSDNVFLNTLKAAGIEGTEEVMQELSQTVIAGGIPGLRYKEDIDINANQLLDSFALGSLGGTIFSAVNFPKQLGESIYDRRVARNFLENPPEDVKFSAAKIPEGPNKGKFGIYMNVNGIVQQLDPDISTLVDEDAPFIFNKFRDANKARRKAETAYINEVSARLAKELPELKGAVVSKIKRNEDGELTYDIEKNGQVIKTFTMEKNQTRKQFSNQYNKIKDINTIVNDYAEESTGELPTLQDDVVDEKQLSENKQKKLVFVKSFMNQQLNEDEQKIEETLEEQNAFNPSTLQRNFLAAVSDKDVVANLDINPEDIVRRLDSQFGPEVAAQAETFLRPPAEPDITPEEGPEITPEETPVSSPVSKDVEFYSIANLPNRTVEELQEVLDTVDENFPKQIDGEPTGAQILMIKNAARKLLERKRQQPIDFTTKANENKQKIKRTIDNVINRAASKINIIDGKPLKINYIDDKGQKFKGEYDGQSRTITINLAYADSTTAFHEIMHPFVESLFVNNREAFDRLFDQLIETPLGQETASDIIEKFAGIDETSPLFKVELVVESIARSADMKTKAQKAENKGFLGIVKRILNLLRSFLFPNAKIGTYNVPADITVDKIATMLAKQDGKDSIIVEDLVKTEEGIYQLVGNFARKQPVDEINEDTGDFVFNKNARNTSKVFFEQAWKEVIKVNKDKGLKASPHDFRVAVRNALGTDNAITIYFEDWYANKFANEKDVKYRSQFNQVNNENNLVPDTVNDYFMDNEIREGLDSVIEEHNSNEKTVGVNEQVFMGALGIRLNKTRLKILRRKARQSINFDEFTNNVIPQFVGARDFSALSPYQQSYTLKFYNRVNSYVLQNLSEGKNNERNNYYYVMEQLESDEFLPSYMKGKAALKLQLKDGINIETGNQNALYDKNYLFETIPGNKLVFEWIAANDYLTQMIPDDPTQEPYVSKMSIFKNPFFKAENLNQLIQTLKANDKALAFMRGESGKIAIVPITSRHKEIVQRNLAGYIQKEKSDGFIPIGDDNIELQFQTASDIAVHEAMKKVWPMYLFDNKGAANTIKRVKIPFTPVTTSKDMPDYNVKIMENDNPQKVLSFVFEGQEPVLANKSIEGLGPKYIADGSTFMSANMRDKLVDFGGASSNYYKGQSIGHNKNVLYHVDGMNTFMGKHEMQIIEPNMEVWYNKGQANEQLIAKVDNNGNIFDADGTEIDVLMTPDEAKVSDGYAFDTVHSLPGKSIGFIKYTNRASETAVHGTQWYNFVEDKNLLQLYKDNIHKKMMQEFAALNNLSLDSPNKTAAQKLEEFFVDKLGTNDTDGFRPTVVEHARLKAGIHPTQEPQLNTLLQTKLVSKIIRSGNQDGTRNTIGANLRGDLDPNEIALSTGSAKYVYQAYANQNGMSLAQAQNVPLEVINTWLANNEVNTMTTRYPVPHIGAAILTRVKRLHERQGIIEMNPFDVYARLEGDQDGDEVQIEFLQSKEQESAIKEALNNLDVQAINLKKYTEGQPKKVFTNVNDRNETLINLYFGARAIGQMANLTTVYGQLKTVLKSLTIDGTDLRLRKLDEPIFFAPEGKNIAYKDFLRYYMQAALDNAEFNLLPEWNYNIQNMYVTMFVKENGEEILDKAQRKRIYNSMKSLIDMHKTPGRIKAGFSYQGDLGKFRYQDTLDLSRDYRNYTLNRIGWLEDTILESQDNPNMGTINKVLFADTDPDYVESPWELAVTAPIIAAEEHISKYGRVGYVDDNVFNANPIVHDNLHLMSTKNLSNEAANILDDAYNQDLENNLVGNKSRKQFLMEEKRKGLLYNQGMSSKWISLWKRTKQVGHQTIDRNDAFIEFKETYDAEFKKLSKSARTIATLKYLQGFLGYVETIGQQTANEMKAFKVRKILPPASKSSIEIQTLDETVLQRYFEIYNQLGLNPEKRSLTAMVKSDVTYQTFDELIMRDC